jgi:tetratricopeptide (TPR) repeat protein
MSLLTELFLFLTPEELNKIRRLKVRGKPKELLELLTNNPVKEEVSKETITSTLQISDAFFDKLSSQLLAKCYNTIVPEEGYALLNRLCVSAGLTKHFYKELQKQVKDLHKLPADKQGEFLRKCMTLILVNVPVMYKDGNVLKQLGDEYIKCQPENKKDYATCYVNCKLLFFKTESYFAKSLINEHAQEIEKEIEGRIVLPANADEVLLFEYYWFITYFYFAIEAFDKCIDISNTAIEKLSKFKSADNDINLTRFNLRLAELYYFSSRFEDSYLLFNKIFNEVPAERIPERGYYRTKFIQIALITNNIERAGLLVKDDMAKVGYTNRDMIVIRDVLSYLKYYMYSGDYDTAFEFLRLGFEKNPKGKMFQYEIELRNIETAYFYLTGDYVTALQMCERNIKFLRDHNLNIKNSDFPHYYLIIKAIYKLKTTGEEFSEKIQQQFERYKKGGYAQYGMLLRRMLQQPLQG